MTTVLFLEADPESLRAAKAVQTECERMGWQPVEIRPVSRTAGSPALLESLRGKKTDVVFVLSPDGREVNDLLTDASPDWRPLVLISGARGQRDLRARGSKS